MKNLPVIATRFALFLLLAGGVNSRAASHTWAQAAGGTYSWTGTQNWAPNTAFPNGAGDNANVTNNITGDVIINLNQLITVGAFNIGDANSSNAFTIATGTLAFTDLIASTANTAFSSTTGQINLYATLSGGSGTGFTKNGVGSLVLTANSGTSAASNFTGAFTTVGRTVITGTAGSIGSTNITVGGNTVTGQSNGGSVLELGNTGIAAPGAGGRIADNATITLRGGGLVFNGGSASTTEEVNVISLVEGNNNIVVNHGGATTSILSTGTLRRSTGALLQLSSNSAVMGSTDRFVVTGSIVGGLTGTGAAGTTSAAILPWAIGGNQNNNGGEAALSSFVTYTGSGFRPLAASEQVTNAYTLNQNVLINNNAGPGSSITINSLDQASFGTISVGANVLTITSGAILFRNGNAGISSTGAGGIDFGTAEGIVWVLQGNPNINTNTISANLMGSGGFTKGGIGTLILSGTNNTYTGTTTVAGGVLQTGTTNVLNGTALALANSNANAIGTFGAKANVVTALNMNGFNQTVASVAGGGSYGGNILLGTGTLTIAGNNTAATYSGSIGGTGAVIKNGTGTQTFRGASGYSGGTTINLGSLLVNNTAGSATGSGAVTVAASGSTSFGTLGGGSGAGNGGLLVSLGAATSQVYAANATGLITGAVTVNQYGHLAPGNSVGTTTVGALTLDGGSVLDWEFNLSANDFVDVQVLAGSTGTLTFAGVTGINLYQEGSVAAFSSPGLYNLFGYDVLSGFNPLTSLTVLNPTSGYTYTFLNDTTNGLVQLNIGAVPEPSSVVLAGLGLAAMLGSRSRRRR